MHSTSNIITFLLIMTTVVALLLSLMFTGLKPLHDRNEAIYNKRAIISAVEEYLPKPVDEMSDDEIQQVFDEQITQQVIDSEGNPVDGQVLLDRGYSGTNAEDVNMAKEKKRPIDDRIFPVFIYNRDGEKYFIVSVRGSGLWDEIWGNIAIEEDFNTIAGAAFDHKAETPGLGAEIKDNPNFSKQFIGKKLYDEGEYVSVEVVKGPVKEPEHQVDGISGATITGNGVSAMMYKGLSHYQPYFESKTTN